MRRPCTSPTWRELGRNPACIIPAWHDFVQQHGKGGRPLRGIGEPIWAGRTDAELTECHRHESLLNLAFANTPAFWLLCPYDKQALPGRCPGRGAAHAPVRRREQREPAQRDATSPPELAAGPFDGELPPPAESPAELTFRRERLRAVRAFVSEYSGRRGLATGAHRRPGARRQRARHQQRAARGWHAARCACGRRTAR